MMTRLQRLTSNHHHPRSLAVNDPATFIPLKGTIGLTAGSEIVDGKFLIPREKGTFVGRFRVEVTTGRPTGRKTADLMTGEPREVYEQFIADKYNTKSELEAEVKGDGRNVFEFAVISK